MAFNSTQPAAAAGGAPAAKRPFADIRPGSIDSGLPANGLSEFLECVLLLSDFCLYIFFIAKMLMRPSPGPSTSTHRPSHGLSWNIC